MKGLAVTPNSLLPYQSLIKNGQPAEAVAKGKDFSAFLKESLNSVNQLHAESNRQTEALVSGQTEDIHQVMIAAEKASIATSMTLQVRNKVMEAYQEIMRMQV
ncbi:flagellar hook-basal body complex protein FliE [Heliorestis acidaminivorans]|uniref:Flagellar hook-basal body complex protein FliE n=1 Tax=Heliorestis acidaminivorans TaxID=553427 RepID=A0A6I0EXA4_9FIRM|nr:flagellar hook-basal body complex protein FliE [Heliorestis acidaminivorans]KAB2954399.1 flagellar hook-basal body complex protein FliE [Heliorestis acidaminivorans]